MYTHVFQHFGAGLTCRVCAVQCAFNWLNSNLFHSRFFEHFFFRPLKYVSTALWYLLCLSAVCLLMLRCFFFFSRFLFCLGLFCAVAYYKPLSQYKVVFQHTYFWLLLFCTANVQVAHLMNVCTHLYTVQCSVTCTDLSPERFSFVFQQSDRGR